MQFSTLGTESNDEVSNQNPNPNQCYAIEYTLLSSHMRSYQRHLNQPMPSLFYHKIESAIDSPLESA